jgi:hypothetical protein
MAYQERERGKTSGKWALNYPDLGAIYNKRDLHAW